MDIEAELFLRKDIDRLGLAPLTSMYWFSETVKPAAVDWRPEVHDSDGLALWTGTGEHIWRPLNNPSRITVSSFVDKSPKGFGLLQRDRVFDHYQDGVRYHLRPSAWIEPLGDWAKARYNSGKFHGRRDTTTSSQCGYLAGGHGGQVYHLRYRIHWLADELPDALAKSYRLGNGGQPGKPATACANSRSNSWANRWRNCLRRKTGARRHRVAQNSRSQSKPCRMAWPATGVLFRPAVGTDPVEMRCYLRVKDKACRRPGSISSSA